MGEPAADYEVKEVNLSPGEVTVAGAESLMTTVATVQGRVNIVDMEKDVVREVRVKPLNEEGEEVKNVKVIPQSIQSRVEIGEREKEALKPVRVPLNGGVATSKEIDEVKIEPAEVLTKGPISVVDGIEVIETEVLDVEGREETFTTTLALRKPSGISSLGTSQVEVTVHIVSK